MEAKDMTLKELEDYIRTMPDDEILRITFEEDEDDGEEV